MAIKTGRQIFEEEIFRNIDLTIVVDSIISDDDPDVEFIVCDLKWLQPGTVVRDVNSGNWDIESIDYQTRTIRGKRPNPMEPLKKGTVFTMQDLNFKSGTPANLDGEIKLEEEADILTFYPIVWLKESIKGRGFDKKNSQARRFDFEFYCLMESNITDWLNKERHEKGVIPMTQLGQSVIDAIELNFGLILSEDWDFNEFNRFGRETETKFEAYILSKNLSGVGYRASVSVAKSVCEC